MNTTMRCVRITIRGRLSRRLLETTFAGMSREETPNGTEIVGVVPDQAALHGILTRIRDLGLELDSVTTSDEQAVERHGRRPSTIP